MVNEKNFATISEGLRQRKRRRMSQRIAVAALALFKERGFNAVTVDQIAEAPDVSKRTFFDYFPSKEDVVGAWQEGFAAALADAIAARPDGELVTQVIEHAIADAILVSIPPDAEFVSELIACTPTLRVRNQFKYVELEWALVEALTSRYPEKPHFKLKMFAMVAVGVLRLGVEEWHQRGLAKTGDLRTFNAEMYSLLWDEIAAARARLDGDADPT